MITNLVALTSILLQAALPGREVTVVVDPQSVADVSERVVSSIQGKAVAVSDSVEALLVEFDGDIRLNVRIVENDLDPVGGVAGWAARPGEVQLIISAAYPGGIESAIDQGLATVLFHEFHHLWRGWTIEQNRFGPGIPNAVVNEGLAAVFADTYSGVAWERFDYPENVQEWLDEILELPLDADYNTWMNDHPDGRIAVGYRTGRYVVHRAMAQSGLGIVELSALSPEEILALVRD